MNVNKPSREIDFRAFSKSRQRMLSCEHLKEATRGMVFTTNKKLKDLGWKTNDSVPNGLFLPLEDDDLVLMQYTGLKDKNGKKIYEGDIIKTKEDILQVVEYHNTPYDETTQNACFGCRTEDEEGTMYFNIDFDDEVIGNIYENPELWVAEWEK